MRSFAYKNENFEKDIYVPELKEDNPCYQPSVYSPSGSTDVLVSSSRTMQNPSAVVVSSGATALSAASPNASQRTLFLNSDLSALSIRATEYLQRWKEVVQFSSKDYSDQMAAQFGIKAPEYMGNHSHYIGVLCLN